MHIFRSFSGTTMPELQISEDKCEDCKKQFFISLLDDKILALSELKAFADTDNKSNVTQNIKYAFHRA